MDLFSGVEQLPCNPLLFGRTCGSKLATSLGEFLRAVIVLSSPGRNRPLRFIRRSHLPDMRLTGFLAAAPCRKNWLIMSSSAFGRARAAWRLNSSLCRRGLLSALPMRVANITPWFTETRRSKYPAEIKSVKDAIAITEAGHGAIQYRLEPGMPEYEAYLTIYDAMVGAAKTSC